MELKTPLYEKHLEQKGKIVPFAGYLLPVQYPTGVITEHMAVRKSAGLFDVSHMGEVTVKGPDSLKWLNHLLTNDFTNMAAGKVRYSVMCYEDGGCVDDLIVYREGETEWYIVVNASNRLKDVEWMKSHLSGDVQLEDISDSVAQLALQGPKAAGILSKLCDASLLPVKYYTFADGISVGGVICRISTTGYTGEGGYELYMPNADAPKVWDMLLEAGGPEGLIPCGLGARDTLRLEAGMPLYGHEMDETITPMETGLDFGVKLGKADFTGKEGIEARLPAARTRVGLYMTGRGIAREHQDVYIGERLVGRTTSGTFCPCLERAAAMALVETESAGIGTKVQVDVRGRRVDAEIVPLPFYKKSH